MKVPYNSPSLTTWGSVIDLTLGTGDTQNTDEFECVVAESGMVAEGSIWGPQCQ